MKRIAILIALASAAHGETIQERGKRIVEEALQALGGASFLDMEDRVEAGRAYSFYREELRGLSVAKIYTRYLTPPSPLTPDFLGVRERQAFGKDEYSAVLFADGKGWEVTYRGARPLRQELVDRFQDTTRRGILYILRMRLKEPGLILESRGADVWSNMPVEMVDITDSENRVTTVFFHRSEKWPVRQVFVRRDPKTRERNEEVTVFSKYRDVGSGIRWPHVIQRERNGEKIFEMYSDSVQVNRNLTDDLFTLPADMKILPPKR